MLFLAGYIILLGVGTFLQKFTLKKLSPYELNFVIALAMIVVSTIALFLKEKSIHIPAQGWALGAMVGIFFSLGSLSFTVALSRMYAGLASALSVSYILVVVLLSWIFLKEEVSVIKLVGIACMLLGAGILYFKQ